MAAEVRQAFPNAEVRMLESSGGVFEVSVDDTLVFSKKALRRHAAPGEALRLITEAAGPG
ncbi:MAG: hypothetical protein H0W67_06950 [Gemmatimonadales bacterium]|nr:hypothetical protein [Gemmatimonadales bacterium]